MRGFVRNSADALRKRLAGEHDSLFLRDLIYFDFDKTASIASQLEGGLTTEIQESYAKLRQVDGRINVPVAQLGGTASDTSTKLQTKTIHHSLLVRVEEALFKAKVAVDINEAFDSELQTMQDLHSKMTTTRYVRVEGFGRLHDYERMKRYLDGLKRILDIGKGEILALYGKAEEYFALRDEIEAKELELSGNPDRNRRKTESGRLVKLKARLREMEDDASLDRTGDSLPDWMIRGFQDVMDLVKPNQNNLILQPFETMAEFKVYCNLKQECFLDSDSDNLLYAYGSQPNVKLTAFGLVTSIPPEDESSESTGIADGTNSSAQESDTSAQSDHLFDQIFDATLPIEAMGRITQYPSVTVYPLAVYYTIRNQK